MTKQENGVKGLILLGLVFGIWEHARVAVCELTGEGAMRLQRSLREGHLPGQSDATDFSKAWTLLQFASNRFDLIMENRIGGTWFTGACLAYTLLIFLHFRLLPVLV